MPHYDGNLRDYVRNPRYSTAMGLLQEGGGAAPPGHEGAKSEELRAGSGTDADMVFPEFLRWLFFSGGKNV
jgi:cell division ATPase FtsA